MKHLYALVLSLFAFIFGASAQSDVTFYLEIDNAEAVTAMKLATVLELQNGVNTIECKAYDQIYISAKSGYLITEAISGFGYEASVSNNSVSIYVTADTNGQTWKIYTSSEADFRNSSFELWVDNPDKLRATLGGTYTPVTGLAAGSNTVKFNAEKESSITLASTDYTKPLYKVIKNGETLPNESDNDYNVFLTDGVKIEVFTEYPDIEVPVKFEFVNENTEASITSVTVAGETIAPEVYLSEDFKVKIGSYLSINGNTTDYKVNSLSLNGEPTYFFGSYGAPVMGESTFSFDVKKYETFTKKIKADHPEHFTLYKGFEYGNEVISFTDGEASVELIENNPVITIILKDGYKLSKLLDGENDITANITPYNKSFNAATTGDVVIETAEIVYDLQFVTYIDDKTSASYLSYTDFMRKNYDLQNGYNLIKYYAELAPFQTSWYGPAFNNLYLNDEKQGGMYGSETMYELNINDGDVVKIFFTCDPASYKLTFKNNYGEGITCTKDMIVPVTDFAEQTVLQGTLVELAAPEGKQLTVTVGDAEPVTAETYSLTVTADTAVTIDDPEMSGINGIGTAVSDEKVYNMQGMFLGTKADLGRLPSGLYIVGGKKYLKK